MVYQKCVSSKQTSPSKTQNKWLTDCQITCSNSINWKVVYKLSFSCTKILKLIFFQFKLLHRRLATNDFLNKIGIRPDDLCTFCRDVREYLIHLFWSYRETNFFWKNFQDWLNKYVISLKHISTLSSAAVLGLKANFFSNIKQYYYFLVARYYIWTCKARFKRRTFHVPNLMLLLSTWKVRRMNQLESADLYSGRLYCPIRLVLPDRTAKDGLRFIRQSFHVPNLMHKLR